MKKILAYLLVLVSLMTLFCGTAGAADNSMDKNGYATTYVSMLVYDTDAKAAKYEKCSGRLLDSCGALLLCDKRWQNLLSGICQRTKGYFFTLQGRH